MPIGPDFAAIRTERLLLAMPRYAEGPAAGDLADYHRLHSDAEAFRHAPWARHPDLAHSQSLLQEMVEDWLHDGLGYWTVREVVDSTYVGTAGVRRGGYVGLDGQRRPDDSWNVYYRFEPQVWGRGYAAEVIRAAAGCLDAGALMHAVIGHDNGPSRRVAEFLGMRVSHVREDPAGRSRLVYEATAAEIVLNRRARR